MNWYVNRISCTESGTQNSYKTLEWLYKAVHHRRGRSLPSLFTELVKELWDQMVSRYEDRPQRSR